MWAWDTQAKHTFRLATASNNTKWDNWSFNLSFAASEAFTFVQVRIFTSKRVVYVSSKLDSRIAG